MFALCTGRAVRGGQGCLVTGQTDSSSRVLLISVPTYSKTSAHAGVEGSRHSILCVLQLHKQTAHKSDYYTFTSPECKSRHIFMLEEGGGGEAALCPRCVLLDCVIGIVLLPAVRSCCKVLCKSADSCEAGKSKGWLNAAWTF